MRTVTRPDVKWLINEAAALAGELERIDREMAALAYRREEIQRSREACLATLALVTSVTTSQIALPIVHVHRAYGSRGELRRFLKAAIAEAAPATVDCDKLARCALAHFGLQIAIPKEYSRFKHNTIGRALRKLEDDGFIERVTTRAAGVSRFSAWRMRREIPSLEALKMTAELAAAEDMDVTGG